MEADSALSFVGSAPFIAMIIGLFIKPMFSQITGRVTPLVALALSVAWGGSLALSDLWEGTVAEFIVTAVIVALAASGTYAVGREYAGKNDPK